MKFEDVKDLSLVELGKRINQRKNDLFDLKMKSHMGQLANPIEVRVARRDIAKMMTAMQQTKQAALETEVSNENVGEES